MKERREEGAESMAVFAHGSLIHMTFKQPLAPSLPVHPFLMLHILLHFILYTSFVFSFKSTLLCSLWQFLIPTSLTLSPLVHLLHIISSPSFSCSSALFPVLLTRSLSEMPSFPPLTDLNVSSSNPLPVES